MKKNKTNLFIPAVSLWVWLSEKCHTPFWMQQGVFLSFIHAETQMHGGDNCVWKGWDNEVEPLRSTFYLSCCQCDHIISPFKHSCLSWDTQANWFKAIFPAMFFDKRIDFTHPHKSADFFSLCSFLFKVLWTVFFRQKHSFLLWLPHFWSLTLISIY